MKQFKVFIVNWW